ncbi:MAG: Sec-independent protein translocase protein TatB [Alphaproteobacteria bacterium]
MFFDLGWSEILVIGAVALVVIGPKELPNALRTAGYWVRKARGLSREFQGSVEQMIREAELDEVRKDLKKATEFDLENEFRKTVDPTGELAESVKLPSVPDYFDETGGRPASAPAAEGSPVATPPPEMIGFDEPGAANGATERPGGKPDEFAVSKA